MTRGHARRACTGPRHRCPGNLFQERHLRQHVEALRRIPGQRQRAVFVEGDRLAMANRKWAFAKPRRLPGHLPVLMFTAVMGAEPLKTSETAIFDHAERCNRAT